MCKVDPEDLKHMLLICERVNEFWKELGLEASVAAEYRSGSLILDETICSNLLGGVPFPGENVGSWRWLHVGIFGGNGVRYLTMKILVRQHDRLYKSKALL